MNKLILIGLLLSSSLLGFSQSQNAKTFVDLSEAKAFAAQHDIPILMVFAGSDWCKPCIQFKKDILLSEAFNQYAISHLAVLYLDFPLKKANKLSPELTAHHEKLAEKYNPSGAFPAILMIDANEQILGPLSFSNQTPAAFIASCKSLIQ